MALTLLSRMGDRGLGQVRWVATDMDGTLTIQGKFTPALVQRLQDLAVAGLKVIIVTGRSAGWVSGLVHYLPVVGAIAENGGIFFPGAGTSESWLVSIADAIAHRQQLAYVFAELQREWPHLQESADNRYRLTDWTFDVVGLTPADLDCLSQRCQTMGWSITYSTVQVHIKRPYQSKAAGLSTVLATLLPDWQPEQVLTVGDSPNDESLFDPALFPLSVGVANVLDYRDRLTHLPAYVTTAPEGGGFCELAHTLIAQVSRRP